MTHIGYAKPQMFLHPRGPRHDNRTITLSNCSLSSYRLQPTSRFLETILSVWDSDVSWSFFPLSAFTTTTCEQVSNLTASRSQVFSTSQRVFSTPHMACRFIPPCWHSKGFAFRVCLLNDVELSSSSHAPSSLPAFHGFLSSKICVPNTLPPGFPLPTT